MRHFHSVPGDADRRRIMGGKGLRWGIMLFACILAAYGLPVHGAGPVKLLPNGTDLVGYFGSEYRSKPSYATIGNTCFFAAHDKTHGTELWKTDGTPAGTMLVKDIMSGSQSSMPAYLTNVNNTLYFYVYQDLWKSDGTASGTVKVCSLLSSPDVWLDYPIPIIDGKLYFRATSQLYCIELATEALTLLKDFGTTVNHVTGQNPANLLPMGNWLFFTANDGVHGNEIWRSDGTPAGTVMIKDIVNILDWDSFLGHPTKVGNYVYFQDLSDGEKLWRTDGTAAGTVMINNAEAPQGLFEVNGKLFFSALQGSSRCLWRTDPTSNDAILVKQIYPIPVNRVVNWLNDPDYLNYMASINGTFYFQADDGIHGLELWKSDGTAAGTVMVKDINPGTTSSSLFSLNIVNGTLYFMADDGTHGRALWKSDGTEAGTRIIATDPLSILPQDNWTPLFSVGNYILCTNDYYESNHYHELWAINTQSLPGHLVAAPGSLNFDRASGLAVNVELGGAPTTRDLMLTNLGDTPLNFTGGNAATPGLKLSGRCAGDFQISKITPATSAPLASGASLTVTVKFAPQATRQTLGLDAALDVTTDSTLTPSLSIPLVGDAVPVRLSKMAVE